MSCCYAYVYWNYARPGEALTTCMCFVNTDEVSSCLEALSKILTCRYLDQTSVYVSRNNMESICCILFSIRNNEEKNETYNSLFYREI